MLRSMRSSTVWLYCCVFFKQKTAYEMRISDWSSDVCSSDLGEGEPRAVRAPSAAGSVARHVGDPKGHGDGHPDGLHHGARRLALLLCGGPGAVVGDRKRVV